jgi:hypothetical protein
MFNRRGIGSKSSFWTRTKGLGIRGLGRCAAAAEHGQAQLRGGLTKLHKSACSTLDALQQSHHHRHVVYDLGSWSKKVPWACWSLVRLRETCSKLLIAASGRSRDMAVHAWCTTGEVASCCKLLRLRILRRAIALSPLALDPCQPCPAGHWFGVLGLVFEGSKRPYLAAARPLNSPACPSSSGILMQSRSRCSLASQSDQTLHQLLLRQPHLI